MIWITLISLTQSSGANGTQILLPHTPPSTRYSCRNQILTIVLVIRTIWIFYSVIRIMSHFLYQLRILSCDLGFTLMQIWSSSAWKLLLWPHNPSRDLCWHIHGSMVARNSQSLSFLWEDDNGFQICHSKICHINCNKEIGSKIGSPALNFPNLWPREWFNKLSDILLRY